MNPSAQELKDTLGTLNQVLFDDAGEILVFKQAIPDMRTDILPVAFYAHTSRVPEDIRLALGISDRLMGENCFVIDELRLSAHWEICRQAWRSKMTPAEMLWKLCAQVAWDKIHWLQDLRMRAGLCKKHPDEIPFKPGEIFLLLPEGVDVELEALEFFVADLVKGTWASSSDYFMPRHGFTSPQEQAEIGYWNCRRRAESDVMGWVVFRIIRSTNITTALQFLCRCRDLALSRIQ